MRDKQKEWGSFLSILDSDRYIEMLIDDGMICIFSWLCGFGTSIQQLHVMVRQCTTPLYLQSMNF